MENSTYFGPELADRTNYNLLKRANFSSVCIIAKFNYLS